MEVFDNPNSSLKAAFDMLMEAISNEAEWYGQRIAGFALANRMRDVACVMECIQQLKRIKDVNEGLFREYEHWQEQRLRQHEKAAETLEIVFAPEQFPPAPPDPSPVKPELDLVTVAEEGQPDPRIPPEFQKMVLEHAPPGVHLVEMTPSEKRNLAARAQIKRDPNLRDGMMTIVLEMIAHKGPLSPAAIGRDLETHHPSMSAVWKTDRSFRNNLYQQLRRKNYIGGGNGVWTITNEGRKFIEVREVRI